MIAFAFLLMLSAISAASDGNIISLLEINIAEKNTSISVNVQTGCTFREVADQNAFEIYLANCTINLLGRDHALIPSFSPLFDMIEIQPDESHQGAILRLKLSAKFEKPVMTINSTRDKIEFNFEGKLKEQQLAQLPIETAVEKPLMPPQPVGELIELLPRTYEETSEKTISNPVPIQPQSTGAIEIPPDIEKTLSENTPELPVDKTIETSSIIEELPRQDIPLSASLESLYYSQGEAGSDVITLEFKDISPRFTQGKDNHGWITVTFDNLALPPELLKQDKLWRDIKGTTIRAIQLRKFANNSKPMFEVSFKTVDNPIIEIEDLGGIIELILRREER